MALLSSNLAYTLLDDMHTLPPRLKLYSGLLKIKSHPHGSHQINDQMHRRADHVNTRHRPAEFTVDSLYATKSLRIFTRFHCVSFTYESWAHMLAS